MTRVVDYGGLFHDDVKPGHQFGPRDHRTFRPPAGSTPGAEKIERMRVIAEAHGLTMLQLACIWNLQHGPVQMRGSDLHPGIRRRGQTDRGKDRGTRLPPGSDSDRGRMGQIAEIGDNTNCMTLKGGSAEHIGDPLPDRWQLNADLEAVAGRWNINPVRDLANAMHSAGARQLQAAR